MKYNFANTTFLSSAAEVDDFTQDIGKEVAFVGRSNVGKSSLINRLCGNSKLAKIAKAPGRTRLINFFTLTETRRLVDLPGYGFANVPKAMRRQWQVLIGDYFACRKSLQGVVVLVDIRRLLAQADWDMIEWCNELPVCVVLTKSDKLKYAAAQTATLQTQAMLNKTGISVYVTSAVTSQGNDEVRLHISQWLA